DGIRDFHVTGVQTCALPILGAELVVNHLHQQGARSLALLSPENKISFTQDIEHSFRKRCAELGLGCRVHSTRDDSMERAGFDGRSEERRGGKGCGERSSTDL